VGERAAPIELWAESQRAFSARGRALDDQAAETPVPACPGWTVRDVYAHLAGAATDILNGNLVGVATDPWTAQQVADRADRSLPEILDEWDEAAPRLVEALAPFGDDLDPRLLADLWTHVQDVRGALGQPGDREGPLTEYVTSRALRAYAQHLVGRSLEPIDLGFVDPYEFTRAFTGRRSPAQMRAWDWPVDDPEPYVEAVPIFGPREADLLEPA
jgi:uncharacterized protein (TIGR03083 family)